MLLIIYLITSTIVASILFLKYNRMKYNVYVLMTIITGLLGWYFEEFGIARGDWSWEPTLISMMNTPVEMILIYAVMGFILAILTIRLREYSTLKPMKWNKKMSMSIFLFGILALIGGSIAYTVDVAVMMFFLFAGIGLYLRYQNPIIIIIGAIGAATDVIFDTGLLFVNGYMTYSITIPYVSFFIVGMFLSGLTMFLNEKLYKD